MNMVSTNEMFHRLLSLTGKMVSVGLLSGEQVNGEILNVMFDSLILRDKKGNHILRFSDLGFVREEM